MIVGRVPVLQQRYDIRHLLCICIADVPSRRLRSLVHQEQSIGDVANIHEIPELQFHLMISCRRAVTGLVWMYSKWLRFQFRVSDFESTAK